MRKILKKIVRARKIALYLGLVATLVLASAAVAGAREGKREIPAVKKGVTNLVESTTALVGFVADGPVLKLDNDSAAGSATALDLQVEPGKAPMKVNSETRVDNLNADRLDGLDSSAFLGANGKAPDADKLDGKDSTEFLGVNDKAADSDKLDGLDANQLADQLANQLFPVFTARNDDFVGIAGAVGAGKTLVSLNLPPGNYVLNGKAGVENLDGNDIAGVNCTLRANGDRIDSGVFDRLAEEAEVGSGEQFALQAVLVDFDGQSPIDLNCAHAIGQSSDVAASDAVLTAIKVGSVQ